MNVLYKKPRVSDWSNKYTRKSIRYTCTRSKTRKCKQKHKTGKNTEDLRWTLNHGDKLSDLFSISLIMFSRSKQDYQIPFSVNPPYPTITERERERERTNERTLSSCGFQQQYVYIYLKIVSILRLEKYNGVLLARAVWIITSNEWRARLATKEKT